MLTYRLATRIPVTHSHYDNKIGQTENRQWVSCRLSGTHLPRQDSNVNRPENELIDDLVRPDGK